MAHNESETPRGAAPEVLDNPRIQQVVAFAEQLGWRSEWDGPIRCAFICDATQTQVVVRWGTAQWPLDYAFAGSIDPTRRDCGALTRLVRDDDGRTADEHIALLQQFLAEHSERDQVASAPEVSVMVRNVSQDKEDQAVDRAPSSEGRPDTKGCSDMSAPQRSRWRTDLEYGLRIALVVVGIPVVWIFRTDLDWSVAKAIGASVLLVLAALGAATLAMIWTR